MKICPACRAENKDANRFCANCQKYIGNVEPAASADSAKVLIQNVERRARRRQFISIGLFLLCYLAYLVFYAYLYYDVLGSLDLWFGLLPAYIPCLVVFIFPYDRFYVWIRRKLHKEPAHLSEYATIALKAAGWIYLFIMYCATFNVLNVAVKH